MTGACSLQEECSSRAVAAEDPDRVIAIPKAQSVRLVLVLRDLRTDHLEDRVRADGRDERVAGGKTFSKLYAPVGSHIACDRRKPLGPFVHRRASIVRTMGRRLSRLAPEEFAAAILLAVALLVVAADPHAVSRIFETPYATPAPESGAATFLRDTRSTPAPSARFATPPILPESARARTIVLTIDGRSRAMQIGDPCWEPAMAALRAGGQPVACAPALAPILAPTLPMPSR